MSHPEISQPEDAEGFFRSRRERRPADLPLRSFVGMILLGSALILVAVVVAGVAFGGYAPWYLGRVSQLLAASWVAGCGWVVIVAAWVGRRR